MRTYLSLQTSTLLCVKNLFAICGGCVLTCPGWANGGDQQRTRHAHAFQTHKEAPLLGSLGLKMLVCPPATL